MLGVHRPCPEAFALRFVNLLGALDGRFHALKQFRAGDAAARGAFVAPVATVDLEEAVVVVSVDILTDGVLIISAQWRVILILPFQAELPLPLI